MDEEKDPAADAAGNSSDVAGAGENAVDPNQPQPPSGPPPHDAASPPWFDAPTLEERRQIAWMLYQIWDALGDVAAKPNPAIPPGLWRPLNNAYLALGNPDTIFKAVTGWPEPPNVEYWADAHGLRASLPIENALLVLASDPQRGGISTDELEKRGFTGVQLDFRTSTISFLYDNYAGHGRISEIPKDDFERVAKRQWPLQQLLSVGASFLSSLGDGLTLGTASEVCGGVAELVSWRAERRG